MSLHPVAARVNSLLLHMAQHHLGKDVASIAPLYGVSVHFAGRDTAARLRVILEWARSLTDAVAHVNLHKGDVQVGVDGGLFDGTPVRLACIPDEVEHPLLGAAKRLTEPISIAQLAEIVEAELAAQAERRPA